MGIESAEPNTTEVTCFIMNTDIAVAAAVQPINRKASR